MPKITVFFTRNIITLTIVIIGMQNHKKSSKSLEIHSLLDRSVQFESRSPMTNRRYVSLGVEITESSLVRSWVEKIKNDSSTPVVE